MFKYDAAEIVPAAVLTASSVRHLFTVTTSTASGVQFTDSALLQSSSGPVVAALANTGAVRFYDESNTLVFEGQLPGPWSVHDAHAIFTTLGTTTALGVVFETTADAPGQTAEFARDESVGDGQWRMLWQQSLQSDGVSDYVMVVEIATTGGIARVGVLERGGTSTRWLFDTPEGGGVDPIGIVDGRLYVAEYATAFRLLRFPITGGAPEVLGTLECGEGRKLQERFLTDDSFFGLFTEEWTASEGTRPRLAAFRIPLQ